MLGLILKLYVDARSEIHATFGQLKRAKTISLTDSIKQSTDVLRSTIFLTVQKVTFKKQFQ